MADRKGKYVSSSDLVPGDIYELSDPNLSQFPSDSLLLSGDCIVNESMLTGLYSVYPKQASSTNISFLRRICSSFKGSCR